MEPKNYRLSTMHNQRNISPKFLQFYLILFDFNKHFIQSASTISFFHSQNVFLYDLYLSHMLKFHLQCIIDSIHSR